MVTRPMTTQDHIAIAQIVVFSFYQVGGSYLCFRHGLGRVVGFRFLVILALARLVGASLLLATLHDATNTGLYVGWAVTNGIGVGPLILILLGLLSRAFDSINYNGTTALSRHVTRIMHLLMLVAIVLVIVGGTQSDYTASGGTIIVHYNTLSRVGMILMIVVIVAVIGQLVLAWKYRSRVAAGDGCILPAVSLSLIFVLVRLAYGCVVILGNKSPSIWVYLAADVLMEFIACLIVEITGFCLPRALTYDEWLPRDVDAEMSHPFTVHGGRRWYSWQK